jgi:bZIP transcription factor
MDDLDFSNLLAQSNMGGQGLGASDAPLFVSPDQLNLSYHDFSLDIDHSPPSGATGWESTPESALVSSFSTPLNLSEQIHGTGSVDWSSAPLFQTFTTESDLTLPAASRTSSSSSIVHPSGSDAKSSSGHRLIERSAGVSKRRKTRDVSPIDLDAIKASGDKKEYKKKKNTEAARKSRAAKAERFSHLEDEINALASQNEQQAEEIQRLKAILARNGIGA